MCTLCATLHVHVDILSFNSICVHASMQLVTTILIIMSIHSIIYLQDNEINIISILVCYIVHDAYCCVEGWKCHMARYQLLPAINCMPSVVDILFLIQFGVTQELPSSCMKTHPSLSQNQKLVQNPSHVYCSFWTLMHSQDKLL